MVSVIGVTATRSPLTHAQLTWLWLRLRDYHRPGIQLHYGDCVNGDAAAFQMAMELGYVTVMHPPVNAWLRAFTIPDVELVPEPYLARNHNMVDMINLLLAVPDGPERPRSGTWATVRYARRVGCSIRNWWYERNVTTS